ncbi:MAG TPA: hypothetical protein VFU15_15080 [Bacteroidia bacterium]|nr:hypothetical protein [Bacteroidia bacterium]
MENPPVTSRVSTGLITGFIIWLMMGLGFIGISVIEFMMKSDHAIVELVVGVIFLGLVSLASTRLKSFRVENNTLYVTHVISRKVTALTEKNIAEATALLNMRQMTTAGMLLNRRFHQLVITPVEGKRFIISSKGATRFMELVHALEKMLGKKLVIEDHG